MKKILILIIILTVTILNSQNKELIKGTFFNQSIHKIDSIAINNGYKSGEFVLFKASFKSNLKGEIFEINIDEKSKIFESGLTSIINQIPILNSSEYLHKGEEMKYGLKFHLKLESKDKRKRRIKKGELSKIKYKSFYIKEYFPVKKIEIVETEKNLFSKIERIPVSINCKNTTDEMELRKCVQNDIRMHINRKFDVNIVSELGLLAGKQKVTIKFIISKSGEIVNIEAEGNHEELIEEGIRVINSFPNFKPGTIDGKPVDVNYTIPITLLVE